MKKSLIRMTENDLHTIIKESVMEILKENDMDEMGTQKQNAFLKKLMGDRHKPEYDNLSVADTSKMIDAELNKQQAAANLGVVYQVVDGDNIQEFGTFREAKKAFDAAVDEYYDLMGSGSPELSLVKVSDICYKFYGRKSGCCLGAVYIKKVKK